MNPELYREIMQEYNEKQLRAQRLRQQRIEELSAKIPELAETDGKLLSYTQALAETLKTASPDIRRENAARIKSDMKALLEKKARLLRQNGYPENYLEDVYCCPLCKDTGFIENTPCVCLKQAEKAKLCAASQTKSETEGESFDTFRLEYYSDVISPKLKTSPRDLMERVLKQCRAFAEKPKGNLLFTGSTGLGKSFLCHAIARSLTESNREVICDSAFILFDRLISHRFGRSDETEYKNKIMNTPTLIIDDLGTENTNSAASAELFNLINHRLINKLPTVISTNLSLDELKDTYSERILSRIIGEYKILPFYGSDIRIIKRKEG